MIVRQFMPADLMLIALQPQQRALSADVATPEYAGLLAQHGEAYTIADGAEIVAIVGLIMQWEGCARAYAFLGEKAGAHMIKVTRRIRAYLQKCTIRRIEAAVQDDFDAGHRWAYLLGFKAEGWMRKYWNDHDALLYARVL
jgi:hypothetical protein